MINISTDVIASLIASHNDRTPKEELDWLGNLWDDMASENQGILQLCQSWMKKIDLEEDDEDVKVLKMNGFIAGASFVYAAFKRHFESQQFEQDFN